MARLISFMILLLINGDCFGADLKFQYPKNPLKEGFILERKSPALWAKRIPEHELQKVPDLGFENLSNKSTRFIALADDYIICDVQYRFDQFGRRITWNDSTKKQNQFLIFSGCSYTFGTGLPDSETLPEILARIHPETHIYNVAIGASSINQTLALIDRKNFSESFSETKGLFVYIYIEDHIARANGIFPQSTWMGVTPSYKKINGEMILEGSIKESHSWQQKLFEFIGTNFYPGKNFPSVQNRHIHYNCDLIEASKKRFNQKFPNGNFVAVEHPVGRNPELANCLKARGINLIQTPMAIGDQDLIKGELHPSGHFNRRWAPILWEKLESYSGSR